MRSTRLAAALLLACLPSWGAIARVTTAVGQDYSGTSFITVATSGTFVATAGNAIAVFVSWGSTSNTVSGVADTALNTYTACPVKVGFNSNEWFYSLNIAGNASNVVTATFSGTQAFNGIHALQYSGVATSSGIDICTAAAGATGTGTTFTSSSWTTTTANEVIFCGAADSVVGAFTATAPFTKQTQDSAPAGATEDNIVSSTQTTQTCGFTVPSSANWVLSVMSLKAAAAGGATPNTRTLTGVGK